MCDSISFNQFGCMCVSGGDAEFCDWAPCVYRSRTTNQRVGRHTGIPPWQLDLTPHCMYTHMNYFVPDFFKYIYIYVCSDLFFLCHIHMHTCMPSTGHWGLRPHGEDHGSDLASVWHWACRDRVTQRCWGHHHPAADAHTEKGYDEGWRCFSVFVANFFFSFCCF